MNNDNKLELALEKALKDVEKDKIGLIQEHSLH